MEFIFFFCYNEKGELQMEKKELSNILNNLLEKINDLGRSL